MTAHCIWFQDSGRSDRGGGKERFSTKRQFPYGQPLLYLRRDAHTGISSVPLFPRREFSKLARRGRTRDARNESRDRVTVSCCFFSFFFLFFLCIPAERSIFLITLGLKKPQEFRSAFTCGCLRADSCPAKTKCATLFVLLSGFGARSICSYVRNLELAYCLKAKNLMNLRWAPRD
ncbi:hypothetical protein BT93_B0680 [Corymbia citriodora subsp. variegata]|nr:hypothetical protein BT93_B0680 [Corymbia citriodora subsp. variegata]